MLFNLLSPRFKQFSRLVGHTEPICKLSVSSTGTMLASGGLFSTISVVYILKYLKDLTEHLFGMFEEGLLSKYQQRVIVQILICTCSLHY